MANKCHIELNTEEIETLVENITPIAKDLHWAIERLKAFGIKVVYNCDTTELDKKVENIVAKSINIVDA